MHDLAARTRSAAGAGGGGPTPEQAVRLAALDAGAGDYLHITRNATPRAYAQDWTSWAELGSGSPGVRSPCATPGRAQMADAHRATVRVARALKTLASQE